MAIDFGPGDLSGIGPLIARNLEGRGVRVIVAGNRGKGDAELYNVRVLLSSSITAAWTDDVLAQASIYNHKFSAVGGIWDEHNIICCLHVDTSYATWKATATV
ncbi:hypothetical protein H0H92_006613 [Tricholoma furcatifolium]|nr:hypothetical protein H0H92_006613 [Tricholoma furcatifolium]